MRAWIRRGREMKPSSSVGLKIPKCMGTGSRIILKKVLLGSSHDVTSNITTYKFEVILTVHRR